MRGQNGGVLPWEGRIKEGYCGYHRRAEYAGGLLWEGRIVECYRGRAELRRVTVGGQGGQVTMGG